MPQDIIVVHAKQTGLHLHGSTELVAGSSWPSGILDGVVATLDTAVEITPEGCQRIVAATFKVKETLPVQVVCGSLAAYPEVVAHNLCIDGQVVIGYIVPVRPVQRSIG